MSTRMPTGGLDLGGTKLLGVAVGAAGEILAERRVPSPEGSEPVVAALAAMARDLGAEVGGLSAVGVGFAGLVDLHGVVRSAPNIGGVDGLALRERLSASASLPVIVDNDANAAAWGEVVHGAAQGVDHALLVTLGTGVGGGIVADGRVYRGSGGLAAEVGHITVDPDGPLCACGGRGHWEALASGGALGRMGREAVNSGGARGILDLARGDPEAVRAEHVSEAARHGDPVALELISVYAGWVALGLGALCNVLDPALVVVGGGLVALGDLLLQPVRLAFRAHLEAAPRRAEIPIVAAALGERAGAIGAAALARELISADIRPPRHLA
ncbi:MAG: ROK family protein [Acidimicrobiia bacterium]